MKLLYVGMPLAKERRLITASERNDFTERLGVMTGEHAVPLPREATS